MNYKLILPPNFEKVPLPGLNPWLAALRSGNYSQCREYLAAERGNHWSYCCLGVLCEVEKRPKITTMNNSHLAFDNHTANLTKHIRQYETLAECGMLPEGCFVTFDLTATKLKVLTEINDCGFSFDEIADILEACFTHID